MVNERHAYQAFPVRCPTLEIPLNVIPILSTKSAQTVGTGLKTIVHLMYWSIMNQVNRETSLLMMRVRFLYRSRFESRCWIFIPLFRG